MEYEISISPEQHNFIISQLATMGYTQATVEASLASEGLKKVTFHKIIICHDAVYDSVTAIYFLLYDKKYSRPPIPESRPDPVAVVSGALTTLTINTPNHSALDTAAQSIPLVVPSGLSASATTSPISSPPTSPIASSSVRLPCFFSCLAKQANKKCQSDAAEALWNVIKSEGVPSPPLARPAPTVERARPLSTIVDGSVPASPPVRKHARERSHTVNNKPDVDSLRKDLLKKVTNWFASQFKPKIHFFFFLSFFLSLLQHRAPPRISTNSSPVSSQSNVLITPLSASLAKSEAHFPVCILPPVVVPLKSCFDR